MGFVFLLARILGGGYLAWEGARRLSAYGRDVMIDQGRSGEFTVVLQGIVALIGGVSIVTGIGVPAGIAFTLLFLVSTSRRMRGFALVRRVALAAATTLLLAIPRPWPFTFVE